MPEPCLRAPRILLALSFRTPNARPIGEHLLDLCDTVPQHNLRRQGAVGCQAVALIRPPACLLLDDAFTGNNAPQRGDNSCAPGENGFIAVYWFRGSTKWPQGFVLIADAAKPA